MQFVILDLEWNTAYSKRLERFVNEIIEFGAVKLDENFEITSTFSSFVKPQIEKKLRSRVKTLTNITNDDVADADDFCTVVNAFTDWIGDIDDTILMSWGDMDIRALIDNCSYYFDNPKIPFVNQYVDLQSYFMNVKGLPKAQQIGLSNAAALIDVDPDSFVHHRALGDSELSAVCFKNAYNKSFNDFISICDEEFYKRILFKPFVVTDIHDKLVDEAALSCKCMDCGKQSKRITDWKFSNNSFRAIFLCKDCNVKYRVNVQFKKLYNQVVTKKTIMPYKKKDEQKG